MAARCHAVLEAWRTLRGTAAPARAPAPPNVAASMRGSERASIAGCGKCGECDVSERV